MKLQIKIKVGRKRRCTANFLGFINEIKDQEEKFYIYVCVSVNIRDFYL